MADNPLDTQVGGDHYKKYAIQPADFIMANNVPWAEGSILSYVVRWRDKGGIQDLEKAKHILEMVIFKERQRINDELNEQARRTQTTGLIATSISGITSPMWSPGT